MKLKHKFIYKPPIGGEHEVYLTGSFNNWRSDELNMHNRNGIYLIELELEKGRYEYKYIVDGNWKLDHSKNICTDKFGNKNSVVFVGEKTKTADRKVGDFVTPEWVKDGIIYQIFTERFCNGNKKLNPDFTEWYYKKSNKLSLAAREGKYRFVKNWYNLEPLSSDPDRHYLFYGGDLAGISKKIDYLKDLGITIIYFNPLVQAASNHKYEAFDYFKIDPHFGTNDDFINLVKQLHHNGIKVIVDFAFNHVGVGFFAFQDCLEKGENSNYHHWFDWHKWPIPKNISKDFDAKEYYQCWWGHAIMPDLNFDLDREHPEENFIRVKNEANINEDLVKYILNVAEFWLETFNIDGFRLDIPNEVPFWFWEKFRKKVKSIKEDVYIVGEIWHNAQEWVNDKYFDAVMNYNYFKDPVYNFFIEGSSAKDFAQIIMEGLTKYPKQATQVMMNLLDSHDTFRFLESAGGDLNKLKLAVLFQMTFVGTPHIFYGDEIGMKGGYDPDNRRPFNWNFHENDQAVQLREWYKKLIRIRKDNQVLRRGEIKFIRADENLLIYKRSFVKKELTVVINNGKQDVELIDDLQEKTDIITAQKWKSLPAKSGVILVNNAGLNDAE